MIVRVDAKMRKFIPLFLKNRLKDLESVLEALEYSDYKTVRILGHDMKGIGGTYGFDTVTDIGRSLEQAAKDSNPEEIRKWVDELLTYLERVEIVYE